MNEAKLWDYVSKYTKSPRDARRIYDYVIRYQSKSRKNLLEEIKANVEMNMTDGAISPIEGFKNILEYLKSL